MCPLISLVPDFLASWGPDSRDIDCELTLSSEGDSFLRFFAARISESESSDVLVEDVSDDIDAARRRTLAPTMFSDYLWNRPCQAVISVEIKIGLFYAH